MRRLLLAALLVLALPAAAQTAATPADSASAAMPDSLAAVDSAAAAADSLRVTVLSDSAGRALDSAAVAALSDTTDALPEDALVGTAVTLYGRDIFTVYGGLGALTGPERARRIGERLDTLTRNPAFDPDSLRIVAGERLTTIQFGDLIVMSVTDADAEAQTLSRSQAAGFYARTSIGSSTAIANVVAGTVLTYTRSFQLGDRIKVGETTGDVVEKTFLVTRLCTPKNEVVSIPNATVLSGQVTNYSEMIRDGRGVIVHTEVTIGYDVPWEKTTGLLLEAAHRAADDPDNGVVTEPPPFVLQTGLGDFSVAYQLNVYTQQARKLPRVLSDLHARIQDVFAEADVEILSPVYQANRDGSPSTVPPPTIASAAAAARSDGDGA